MLDVAIKYSEELQELFYSVWFNEKYKYWNFSQCYYKSIIEESTESCHQFVSVKDGKVIGYIGYQISRDCNDVAGLNIINFTDDIITFGKDVRQAIDDIFVKFKFRKITFNTITKNPIIKSYNKLIESYGGRIVGVQLEHVKLIDGEFYDNMIFELFREEYMDKIFRKN